MRDRLGASPRRGLPHSAAMAGTVIFGAAMLCAMLARSASAADERDKLPEPVVVDLPTRDGLVLKATYFGQGQARKAAPVVMLHDHTETRNVYASLAQGLQKRGFAVLLPDLRAHGASTMPTPARNGEALKFDPAKLTKPDFLRMARFDMESARRFLVARNNEEEVNLNQLSLVGAGMGATVALLWTAHDWTVPPLARGKQGQDVKALVLVSPEMVFKGISVQPPLKLLGTPAIQQQVSVLILVGGTDARAVREADKLHRILAAYQPAAAAQLPDERKSLLYKPIDTSLQGTKLLRLETARWDEDIAKFLEWRVTGQDFAWSKRGG